MNLLTVDIWDTVLRRRCHPDDIKRATARYLLLRGGERIKEKYQSSEKLFSARVESERTIGETLKESGKDDEYEIHDVFKAWLMRVSGELDDSLVTELYDYELSQEKKCSYIDPNIINVIQSHPHDRLGYVSDFYADFIDELLEHHSFKLKFDVKYVSCCIGLNKRSGRLYDFVKSVENPEHWTHIGDNPYSDFNIPRRKGINAELYPSQKTDKESIEDICLKVNCARQEEKLGARAGIFFYTFVADIIERCTRTGIKQIYYFTREGEFFKQIHDEICSCNPYGTELPKAKILEVSRRSTFAPSLKKVDTEEMMRLWSQYSTQSMSAMFKSLDMEESDFLPLLNKYGLSPEEDIVYPWMDDRVKSMFSDDEFQKITKAQLKEKRKLLKTYLTASGVDEFERFAIVDIGWRGTIQDNLCVLMPDKEIVGFYIALSPFLNPQPVNAEKRGFINASEFYDQIMKCITPFEMLCNSPNGSTLSYELLDGNAVAKRLIEEDENRVFYGFTQYFQEGVIKAIPELCKYCDIHGMTAENLYVFAIKMMYGLLENPDKTFANAYFSLKHNEEFGVGKFIDKHTKFKPLLFAEALISSSKREELKEFVYSTTWVQGYMKKYHLLPFLRIYKRLRGKAD